MLQYKVKIKKKKKKVPAHKKCLRKVNVRDCSNSQSQRTDLEEARNRDIVRQVGSEDHITKFFKISGYQNPVFFCFS